MWGRHLYYRFDCGGLPFFLTRTAEAERIKAFSVTSSAL